MWQRPVTVFTVQICILYEAIVNNYFEKKIKPVSHQPYQFISVPNAILWWSPPLSAFVTGGPTEVLRALRLHCLPVWLHWRWVLEGSLSPGYRGDICWHGITNTVSIHKPIQWQEVCNANHYAATTSMTQSLCLLPQKASATSSWWWCFTNKQLQRAELGALNWGKVRITWQKVQKKWPFLQKLRKAKQKPFNWATQKRVDHEDIWHLRTAVLTQNWNISFKSKHQSHPSVVQSGRRWK